MFFTKYPHRSNLVVHGRPKSVRVNDTLPIQKVETVDLTGQRLQVGVIRVR